MNALTAFFQPLWQSVIDGNILLFLLYSILYFAGIAIFIIINVLMLVWLERKVAAYFQERVGPNRVGPFGLLQTINDTVKLLGKEAIIPKAVDKKIYLLAPMLIFTTTIMLFSLFPYDKNIHASNFNLGILIFIAVSSTTTISILMAGWGSNNKYALLGGMRAVAQLVSYEIPFAFSFIGIVMLAGTLNLNEIVEAQKNLWYIALQPLAFILFLITGQAELNRSPFDVPEAEQELTGSFHTEYSGIRFALIFLAEYANVFCISALGATVFLGGWSGPFLPGWLWFIIKVYFLIWVSFWIRWTFPRIRIDRMMKLNWKVLIPLSLINLLFTGIGIKIFQYIK